MFDVVKGQYDITTIICRQHQKAKKNRKDLFQGPRALKHNSKVSISVMSPGISAWCYSLIWQSLASNTIGVNVFRYKKHLRLGLAWCFVTKLGKNLLRGLAPCCPDQVRCSLCLFIPDRNLIQSRNTLCNRVYFWPLPCGNSWSNNFKMISINKSMSR